MLYKLIFQAHKMDILGEASFSCFDKLFNRIRKNIEKRTKCVFLYSFLCPLCIKNVLKEGGKGIEG